MIKHFHPTLCWTSMFHVLPAFKADFQSTLYSLRVCFHFCSELVIVYTKFLSPPLWVVSFRSAMSWNISFFVFFVQKSTTRIDTDVGTHFFYTFFIVLFRCFHCKPDFLLFADGFRNQLLFLLSSFDLFLETCSSWPKFWIWSTFLILKLQEKEKLLMRKFCTAV